MAKVQVNYTKSIHLIEPAKSAKDREEKERAPLVERHRLAEKTRRFEEELHGLQQMEKDRLTDEQTRELHGPREMENACTADE